MARGQRPIKMETYYSGEWQIRTSWQRETRMDKRWYLLYGSKGFGAMVDCTRVHVLCKKGEVLVSGLPIAASQYNSFTVFDEKKPFPWNTKVALPSSFTFE